MQCDICEDDYEIVDMSVVEYVNENDVIVEMYVCDGCDVDDVEIVSAKKML